MFLLIVKHKSPTLIICVNSYITSAHLVIPLIKTVSSSLFIFFWNPNQIDRPLSYCILNFFPFLSFLLESKLVRFMLRGNNAFLVHLGNSEIVTVCKTQTEITINDDIGLLFIIFCLNTQFVRVWWSYNVSNMSHYMKIFKKMQLIREPSITCSHIWQVDIPKCV